jgi:hypothetical protein
MAIEAFYPEMHEPKPKADGELRRSYAGGWLIKTKLELSGRGISLERTLTSKDLVPQAQHKVGWHEYTMDRRLGTRNKALIVRAGVAHLLANVAA